MRTFERYTFKLVVTNLTTSVSNEYVVHPAYDSLKMKYSRQSGEMYYNKDIDTEFTLINDECDIVKQSSYYTKFVLEIYDRGTKIAEGAFRKTECKFDNDKRTAKFSVNANVLYELIESKKGDEYDLIKLGLEKRNLSYTIYPMVQYYELGTMNMLNIVQCEMAHKESATQIDALSELVGIDKDGAFSRQNIADTVSLYIRITIPSGQEGAGTYEYFGMWYVKVGTTYHYRIPKVGDNTWYFKMEITNDNYGYTVGLALFDNNNHRKTTTNWLEEASMMTEDSIIIFTEDGSSGYIASMKISACLCRAIGRTFTSDERVPSDWSNIAFAIGGADPMYSGKGMKNWCTIKQPYSHIVSCTTFSATDQGYGHKPNDPTQFYCKPDNQHIYAPIMTTCWSDYHSFWVAVDEMSADAALIQGRNNTQNVTCKDMYEIGSVIKALLAKIDSRISFEPNYNYSHFLYDPINPVSSQPNGSMLITQKTNIIYTGYEYPAWKAPIHLEYILDFLKNGLNCYWYLDSENHFHIEHISYFIKGMTYGIDPRNKVVLSDRYDARNVRPQSYMTNKWQYKGADKQTTRIEFSWMDETGEIFDDYPIVVTDAYKFSETEQTEKRKVSMVTTDINFIYAMSDGVSNEGFAVATTQYIGGDNIEIGTAKKDGIEFSLQNSGMSFFHIIPLYMLYNIQSEKVTLHDEVQLHNVPVIDKMRQNDVTFQVNDGEVVTPMTLIETGVGIGEIESLELDLATNTAKATLKYELDIQ